MRQNDFIVIRHSYDDHSYIDGKNNTFLTPKGVEIAKKASERILSQIDSNKVIIRHSSKIRARQTAEILRETFSKHNIDCQCKQDDGLTELFQGSFNFEGMNHIEKVEFLQSCWDDFEDCRKKEDLNHHFGQNKSRKIVLNPGESHSEWSVRISRGVLNIINDLNQSFQSINVTHRGAIFEIQRIVEMVNGQIDFDQVEQYKTMWMEYCQDYLLHIDDLDSAKTLVRKYVYNRSKNEDNH